MFVVYPVPAHSLFSPVSPFADMKGPKRARGGKKGGGVFNFYFNTK
jgi:hypothetical protein